MIRNRHPAGRPPELLVYNGLAPCPYLHGQTARLPMRLPTRAVTPPELAERLAAGDRRQGFFLYRPACPDCQACEAIRVEAATFRPSRTQRRIFRRGEAALEVEVARPSITPEKVALYNRHKVERRLVVGGEMLDALTYEQFLVESCTDTIELTYRYAGALVAVAIVDRAADALSAVYTYFDPDYGRWSPGVYSILKQIAFCRAWGLRYLYLGLYVRDCPALSYKTRYLPHERRIGGVWRRWEHAGAARAAEQPPPAARDTP